MTLGNHPLRASATCLLRSPDHPMKILIDHPATNLSAIMGPKTLRRPSASAFSVTLVFGETRFELCGLSHERAVEISPRHASAREAACASARRRCAHRLTKSKACRRQRELGCVCGRELVATLSLIVRSELVRGNAHRFCYPHSPAGGHLRGASGSTPDQRSRSTANRIARTIRRLPAACSARRL